MAAPHVSGALALVKSKFPWERYNGVRDRVLMGVDRVANPDGTLKFAGTCRTQGRLNLFKALQPRSMIRNLSTRARVENNERVMIGGFTIGGSGGGSLKVAIRGLGPSLDAQLTVPALNNPKIRLTHSAGH